MRIESSGLRLSLLAVAGLCGFVAAAQTGDRPRLVVQASSGSIVNACAFSPDGRAVLSGGWESIARLWDGETGDELQSYQAASWIQHLAVSADNRRVLTVSGTDGNSLLQVWDEATGRELRQIPLASGSFAFAAFSPDGSRVTTASPVETGDQKPAPGGGMKIQVWNLETGKELEHWVVLEQMGPMPVVALSPDGSRLFVGDFASPLLVEVKTGRVLQRFPSHHEVIEAAAFSPDGRSVFAGTTFGVVRRTDTETGKEIGQFAETDPKQYVGSVNSIAVSADGRSALIASNDKTLRLWDVQTGKILQRFVGQSDSAQCGSISPDGNRALSGGKDRTVRLWDAETGKQVLRYTGYSDAFGSLAYPAFSANGGVLTVSDSGMAWLWDAQTGKPAQLPWEAAQFPSSVISPDGRMVYRDSAKGQGVWDAETGKQVLAIDKAAAGNVVAAAFPPAGHDQLATSDGEAVLVWDLRKGKQLYRFEAKPGWRPRLLYPEGDQNPSVITLALSPDGKRVLTGDWEGSVRLWNAASGIHTQSFKVQSVRKIALGFSPDGRKMLMAASDHSTELRDTKTGEELQQFSTASEPPAHGAAGLPMVSADGGRVLLGNSVWDVESGKQIQRLVAPSGNAISGAISPDGRRVLLGYDDGAARLWDVESGKELARMYCFNDGSWAVVDPEGRFDTDKIEGNLALHWVTGSNPMRVLPLAAFQREYYTPRLLARVLSGEKLPTIR
jgi:WD40 repeat protein